MTTFETKRDTTAPIVRAAGSPVAAGSHRLPHDNQRGAVVLEFALVCVMFFALTLGGAAFGYYVALWNILNKGAHEGINLAAKLSGINAEAITDPAFLEAKNKVIEKTREFPLASNLLRQDWITINFIRPGDPNHPTYDNLQIQAGDSVSALLRQHPIVIEVRTTFPVQIPLIGSFGVNALALGYYEGV